MSHSPVMVDTPFLYNGRDGVMTDDTGLYYMRARYYNPEIRRFVNQDVLLGEIAEGQTLNRYAYVTGEPVRFVDPFGLSKDVWCFHGKNVGPCYNKNEPGDDEFDNGAKKHDESVSSSASGWFNVFKYSEDWKADLVFAWEAARAKNIKKGIVGQGVRAGAVVLETTVGTLKLCVEVVKRNTVKEKKDSLFSEFFFQLYRDEIRALYIEQVFGPIYYID